LSGVIQLEKVHKSFSHGSGLSLFKTEKAISVFENLDFSLEKHGLHIIHGSNGSGKTTLLKLIAGLLLPDKGFCKKMESPLSFAFIFSDSRSFYLRLSARKNLDFFLKVWGLSIEEPVLRQLCAVLCLDPPSLDKPYQTLSTGMERLKDKVPRTVFIFVQGTPNEQNTIRISPG